MPTTPQIAEADGPDALVSLIGAAAWAERIAVIEASVASGSRAGRATQQRHAIEITLQRLRGRPNRQPTPAERRISALAADLASLEPTLGRKGRDRLRARVARALTDGNTLVPLLHLIHVVRLQRARGFDVAYEGLDAGAPFDLLLTRDGMEAEAACEMVSAEDGRYVHRNAWVRLADAVDPDLQTWLAAHPGRYLLKMTLPMGLRDTEGPTACLASLHQHIRALLASPSRANQDEAAAVLRLHPLLLAGAQADELGLMSSLRQEFGPEAHLSVTAGGRSVFVMAARGGKEDDVAAAVRRRMTAMAPARLTGARPGILAMFIEDMDRQEWHSLRQGRLLETEARQFLTQPEARGIVAVSCASRLELLGLETPDTAPDGELRFRNLSHPAARNAALAPAVLSSM